jgi:hypothetical protein
MVKFETQNNKMDIFDHHTLVDLNLDSVSKEQEELANTQAEVILHLYVYLSLCLIFSLLSFLLTLSFSLFLVDFEATGSDAIAVPNIARTKGCS